MKNFKNNKIKIQKKNRKIECDRMRWESEKKRGPTKIWEGVSEEEIERELKPTKNNDNEKGPWLQNSIEKKTRTESSSKT